MRMRLRFNDFSSYGVRALAGKVLALFLIVLPAVAAGQVTVAALGDSLTQGYGLISQEGFVPQLRDWLAQKGRDVRVVNAGVSGDTSAGGLARVEWTLTPDVDAMIVVLGGNDLLRGIDPAVTRANIEGILQAASDADVEVLLVGMEAPGNYGPEYKAEFDAIWPELSRAYGALYHPSFFEGLGADDPAGAMRYMQPDGIHPNAEGVRRIVERVGPKVIELIERVQ
ncbi:MAG: arylesterase [Sediminimonas qiaohouensis]|uniref:Arylesterase n=1 Tax=Sediminimonas qiaohouensis TaxID=552061 RepID=A0A7C9HBB6_9RHOB|nr:arylesterase [Sediminimonas qiaohouensis]MTJ04870.1 arylesterase [Sediminimonas qiaohouensis]